MTHTNSERVIRVITSYTSNTIGSGKYCECGMELTHEEYGEQKYSSKICTHRKGKRT